MKLYARKITNLSKSLNRQLNSYALAASAAGVSALALAPPVEAKIVYTKTHIMISSSAPALIDLAHNGTNEFSIWRRSSARSTSSVGARSLKSQDRVWGQLQAQAIFASALPKGFRIASNKKHFSRGGEYGKLLFRYLDGCRTTNGRTTCSPTSIGQWKQPVDAYLGFKFQLSGKTHFGWARISWTKGNLPLLLGYAYETVANKPITAGKTKGPDVVTVQPGSLGALAAGVARRSVQ